MTAVVDSAIRREAVTTAGHAFVWASAGTGKTHTLTLRALYLLLSQAAPELYMAQDRPSRLRAAGEILGTIVLTTFTRKAAAEMRHRLYSYLDAVAAGHPPASVGLADDPLVEELVETVCRSRRCDIARLRGGAAALAERAAELQISTLHSFAAGILRRHPLAAGLPPGVHFAREDEDDLTGLEQQLIDLWWQTEAIAGGPTGDRLTGLLRTVDVSQINRWLETALDCPWLAQELTMPSPPHEEVRSAIEAVEAVADFLTAASGAKMKRVGARLQSLASGLGAEPESAWPRLQRLCLDQRSYLFGSARTKSLLAFIDRLDPGLQRWFTDPAALRTVAVSEWLSACAGDQWRNWRRLLGDFTTWARRAAVRELGLVTFDEMIGRSVELLEEHPEIRRQERGRLKALLVDEFQDTDDEQLRLIELLMSGPQGPLGFFVGDLKQSIYRFRGADVEAVRRFRTRFPEATALDCNDFQLTSTFRTAPSVARFANGLFGDVMSVASEPEILHPVRDTPTPAPRWWRLDSIDGAPLTAWRARREAALRTVELIREYCPSRYDYGEVLILTRDYKELDALLPELQSADIPTISSGARTFFSQPEVLDTLNLLIALHSRHDPLSVAALLRSPLLQVADDQIHSLLEAIPPAELLDDERDLPEWLPAPVTRRIEQLRQLRRSRPETATDIWLHEVSSFIPRTVYVAGHDREGRALVRIDRVLEEFGRFSATSRAPLQWLIRQRERAASGRFDADLGEDVSLADETLDAVRAMTIHKAKGLEARLVLVVGWSSVLESTADPRPGQPAAIETRPADGSCLRGFSLPWGPVRVISADYDEACRLEAAGDCEEAGRLAYVAATRARDELLLLNPVWKRWDCDAGVTAMLESPPDWVTIEGGRASERGEPTPTASAPALDRDFYRRHWNDLFEMSSEQRGGLFRPAGDSAEETGADELLQLEVGRLVHAGLERDLLGEWNADSQDPGEGRPEAIAVSRQLLTDFFQGRCRDASGTPYRDRVRSSRVLGREIPLLLNHQGRRWSGVIDLVLDEGDRVVGVDYKSGPRLDVLPADYRRQRTIYLEGLRRLYPDREVDFEFWWLGPPAREEPPGPAQGELPF